MNFIIENKNPSILSFRFDCTELLEFLESNKNNTKTEQISTYGLDFNQETLRSKIHWSVEKYEQTLSPILNFLSENKSLIIDYLIENSSRNNWPKGKSTIIAEETYIYKSLYIYYPGFSMDSHCDNRLILCSGFINLDDNESVTYFTKTLEGDEIFRCSGEKNKGYIWLNTDDSYHSVDLIVRERKIFFFNLVFAQF
jgi:hypothetical protein